MVEPFVLLWEDLPRRLDARTAAWLVDAVVPGAFPGTWESDGAAPQGLLAGALVQGVEGWVRSRAVATGREIHGLDHAVHASLGRHQRALADLAAVEAVLSATGIAFLVVKGPAIARRYPSPDLRSYVDLDVLVAPDCVGVALVALEASGFRLRDRNWPLLLAADVHELDLATPSGGTLDLHWSLGPTPISRDRSPSVDVLMRRSVEFRAGTTTVRGLGPSDEVVHLAVHAAAAGGHRLIWLSDLRAALEAMPRRSCDLRSAAAAWGAEPAVALMLDRLRHTLGERLPGGSSVPRIEASQTWAWVARGALRLSPPQRTGVGGSLARAVARSSGASSAASLRTLVGKTPHLVTRGPRGPADPRGLLDAADPRSARFAAGGAEGRRDFLRKVERRA